jgi:hypothetical protein
MAKKFGSPTFLPIINVSMLELLNVHNSPFRLSYLSLCQRTVLSMRFLCQSSLISIDTTSICNFNINAQICQRMGKSMHVYSIYCLHYYIYILVYHIL